jgi:hypothetical protein
MNGRRWNNAVGMLRVAKIYACHSYEFILFEMGIGGRLRDEVDVGPRALWIQYITAVRHL